MSPSFRDRSSMFPKSPSSMRWWVSDGTTLLQESLTGPQIYPQLAFTTLSKGIQMPPKEDGFFTSARKISYKMNKKVTRSFMKITTLLCHSWNIFKSNNAHIQSFKMENMQHFIHNSNIKHNNYYSLLTLVCFFTFMSSSFLPENCDQGKFIKEWKVMKFQNDDD